MRSFCPQVGGYRTSIGRKRFYMLCVGIFTFASLLCGLASSLDTSHSCSASSRGSGAAACRPASRPCSLTRSLPRSVPRRSRCTVSPSSWRRPSVRHSAAGSPTIIPGIGFSSSTSRLVSSRLPSSHWLVEEPEILQRERRARLARGLNIDWLGILLIALTFGCLEIYARPRRD